MPADFSIAVPVLNGGASLRRAVGSIRAQSDVLCEILLQDGGSIDGTREWAAKQTDVEYSGEKDGGMYQAINRAWSRGSAHLLGHLNADEQYLPGTLSKVKSFFDTHPEVDMVFGDYLLVDESGRLLSARREIDLDSDILRVGPLTAMTVATFYRRRVLDVLGGYDESFRILSDKDFVIRFLDAGLRAVHYSFYSGLFTMGEENLSLSQQSEREQVELRRRHPTPGAVSVLALRACRFLRKFQAGCYRKERVSYSFVLDETGRAELREATVGTRWVWR